MDGESRHVGIEEEKPLLLPLLERLTCKDDDESHATYVFQKESHTLGNAIRYVLSRTRGVGFVGYSIPHPNEDKMHLRLQMLDGRSADEALCQGFKDLEEMILAVKNEFIASNLKEEPLMNKRSPDEIEPETEPMVVEDA
mmetsp:Transcript_7280/g.14929  ORF Transcript_7280/g.14929 Transcript_7280/m.14929 type:complete len:140 (-) Transcript_7280:4569-4988(-)|eukprot:CAMPEP_0184688680 /NCGR_PEP_ID=MMETSP0312-20130426/30231_1 /TAXON_ID=31354 /ORGANISM="Compsopogon coeruleus, Strain SAG 36.94" /LENGTH=139 /DNA_ID=CAMNT_0027145939 /DNA_START=111 /DNA_END=530 /DNA_ORIENTATION=-